MIKENKTDIIEDLKRMIKSLNKREKTKFFNFLKEYDKNYIILTKNEYDKIKSSLNEAYLNGYDEGFSKGKEIIKINENKEDNESKTDLKTEDVSENINTSNIEKQFLNLIKCFHI